ncbi:MFS transporter [Phytohabitans rumicis]|uniref:MFS transporter n=1 Tax=Phytohabitans rumicis TaxID=1076125 RepID=A0A6V8LF57_9ACTN|nr:MFS transporter [Phytohabitans rumicis]GFJ94924.1 MFS transporter [Phytohabitans rumicis]
MEAYRTLLRVPGVPAQAVGGLLAQVTQGVAPIGTVLIVDEAAGSLTVAGLAVAGFSLGAGVARPVQGRIIDARGPRPVLAATGAVHAAALVALVLGARYGVPAWTLVALATLAGLALPPVSVTMRVAWGQLADPAGRTAAYSLVFLVQELAILAGPLAFAVIVAAVSTRTAVAVVAVAAGAGTFALAWTVRGVRASTAAGPRSNPLRSNGMRLLFAVVVLVGGTIGALEVGLPALASERGAPAASGALVAALSLGGIAGAIGYGVPRWTVRPAARLVALLAAMAGALALVAVLGPLAAIGVALFLAGIALNPALTTASLLVDELTTAQAEAFGWLSTAIGVGGAAAGALAGVVGQRAGAAGALALPALFAIAGALLALPLTRPPPAG